MATHRTAQWALSSVSIAKNVFKVTWIWNLGLNGMAWAFEK
jgi:hypothetical protein